jgi:hypothetical protein
MGRLTREDWEELEDTLCREKELYTQADISELIIALRNLTQSPVVVDDDRMPYITVLIDRDEWNGAKEILKKYQERTE